MTARAMINHLMKVRGVRTHAKLAFDLGMHASLLSKWDTGVRDDIKMSSLIMLSKTSGVPVGLLAELWAEPKGEYE